MWGSHNLVEPVPLMGMCESDSPEVKASCLHTTTEAHIFFFHHPQRGRITVPCFFLLIMLPEVSLFISALRLLFLAFWYLMSRWPNWGGLKPLLIKFQAGWLPRESGWVWSQATWCPPSTAASWEKVDLPEGPCDLPAMLAGPALADRVIWAQWRAHRSFEALR